MTSNIPISDIAWCTAKNREDDKGVKEAIEAQPQLVLIPPGYVTDKLALASVM